MIIYVLTFAIFAVVLLGAFRSMGGETIDDTAATAFLGRMVGWVSAECDAVAIFGSLAADRIPPETLAGTEPLDERARVARKTLAGYQQQLTRFEIGDPSAAARRVRTLLSTAIESLGWACRIAEAGSINTNPGVRTAVAQFYDHARACLDEARELEPAVIAEVPVAEPVSS